MRICVTLVDLLELVIVFTYDTFGKCFTSISDLLYHGFIRGFTFDLKFLPR